MTTRKLTPRQLLLSILASWHDLSWKELGVAAGMKQKQVSQALRPSARRKDLSRRAYERLLAAIPAPRAAVEIVTACVESLSALERDELTAEERAVVEKAALETARQTREILTEAVRLSRSAPIQGYPAKEEVAPSRQRAAELWGRLAELSEEARLGVVRVAEAFQSWALCERVCDESEREASRQVERAAGLARLAQEIAERVPGPEEWRNRLRGYAGAHAANVLRVSGELIAADAALEQAKRIWQAGSDPASVLDPGRLPDLEASLRRDQRRFDEALIALDGASAIGRSPARALLKKGFTLEVMGDYGRAVETLLHAAPLVESLGDPRLLYMLRFNLGVNYCHIGRYTEAADHMHSVRELAGALGDEVFLIRVVWLEGRIAAGLGRTEEALRLLVQARRELGRRNLMADAALVLLEEAFLLLNAGRSIGGLGKELARLLDSKGIHREALAALRLFQKAAESETANPEMIRRLLGYLYRARYDQGLQLTL